MSLWKPSDYSRLSISSIFAFARYDPLFLEAVRVLMHLLSAACVWQGSAMWSMLTNAHFVPFSGSEFLILLPLFHKYWNYRHVPLHLTYFFLFFIFCIRKHRHKNTVPNSRSHYKVWQKIQIKIVWFQRALQAHCDTNFYKYATLKIYIVEVLFWVIFM